MLMIVPRRCRIIAGSTARQDTITARRLTARSASQSLGFVPTTGPNEATPAAVTRMSTWPSSATVWSIMASTAPSWVTSVGMASAVPPLSRILAGARRQHHAGRLARQRQRDGVADPAPGAGDDRDLTGERAPRGAQM